MGICALALFSTTTGPFGVAGWQRSQTEMVISHGQTSISCVTMGLLLSLVLWEHLLLS